MSTRKGTIEVNGAGESIVKRVVSRDGTEIAYWTSGDGPPLVLVHGTTADHTRWRPLLPHLEPHATVHAMDRRGRGASGDAPDYELAREFEDVVAVIEGVAEASGSAVDVYGHSHGGLCAFHAARLTSNVRKLVLYEGWPPANPDAFPLPPGVAERLDALLAEGNSEGALETFMRDVVRVSEEELVAIKSQPSWPARVAAAHTIPRESVRVDAFDPGQAAEITAPTLLLTGGDSPDFLRNGIEAVAAARPDARVAVIEGQQHLADVLVPEVFAEHVFAFLQGRR